MEKKCTLREERRWRNRVNRKKYVSEGRKEGWPEGMFTHFWKYEIDADESK